MTYKKKTRQPVWSCLRSKILLSLSF